VVSKSITRSLAISSFSSNVLSEFGYGRNYRQLRLSERPGRGT